MFTDDQYTNKEIIDNLKLKVDERGLGFGSFITQKDIDMFNEVYRPWLMNTVSK